jgi:hypothetical protein
MAKATGRRPLQRPLNLGDLAILVLATATGLMAIRQDLEALFTRPPGLLVSRKEFYVWINPIVLIKAITVEVWLRAWTAGWLILQLRQPRLRLRRLSRHPGFLACFSSVVVTLVSGSLIWAISCSTTSGTNGWLDRVVWAEMVSCQIGLAVLAGWACLAASGRCCLDAGWLDRVGQFMGLIWVAMIPVNLLHFFWHSLPDGGWAN